MVRGYCICTTSRTTYVVLRVDVLVVASGTDSGTLGPVLRTSLVHPVGVLVRRSYAATQLGSVQKIFGTGR
jgi:hypothetical protein